MHFFGLCLIHHFRKGYAPIMNFSSSSMALNKELRARYDNLWSRIRVVNSENESSKIVSKILKAGEPIAVDVEGTNLPILGLVQIKTWNGQIYLFRTGKNPEILKSGGLRELFESQDILKVFHASTIDSLGIYKEGIQMWNTYDTALAHKVIQYQNLGISTVSAPTISFSDLCEIYGFEDNPLKQRLGKSLFLHEDLFCQEKPLPTDVILYSAADVDPLLDIYVITESLMEKDYLPLFHELCENELVRAVDPDLTKRRQNQRRREESYTIFLKDYDQSITKPKLYQIMSIYGVTSKVMASYINKTAHILVNSRNSAVSVENELNSSQPEKQFGPNCKIHLLKGLKLSEYEDRADGSSEFHRKLRESRFIVDETVGKELIDMILQVKPPVVIDAHTMPYGVTVDIFVGLQPPLRFEVTSATISGFGVGKLLSSPDVTKIVGRIDSCSLNSVLLTCVRSNCVPKNFFDLSTGIKALGYIYNGESISKSSCPSVKYAARGLDITASTPQDLSLFVYLYLKKTLPSEVLKYVDEKSVMDLEIGSSSKHTGFKTRKKELRAKYEDSVVHVSNRFAQPQSEFKQGLDQMISTLGIPCLQIIMKDSNALLCLEQPADAERFFYGNYSSVQPHLVFSRVDLKPAGNLPKVEPNSEKYFTSVKNDYLQKLDQLGFSKVYNNYIETLD